MPQEENAYRDRPSLDGHQSTLTLYSTTEDLLRWDQSLYTERLVTRKSLTAMFRPYVAIVGYGWTIESQFNHKMISHEGGVQGFVSKIARYPDDQITIIALSNLDTAPMTNISKDLAASVFGDKYDLPREHKFIHLNQSKLNAYAEKYQVEAAADIVITISVQEDKLVSQVQGQSFVLLLESETKFAAEDSSAQVVFVRDEKGRITSLIFNGQFNSNKIQ